MKPSPATYIKLSPKKVAALQKEMDAAFSGKPANKVSTQTHRRISSDLQDIQNMSQSKGLKHGLQRGIKIINEWIKKSGIDKVPHILTYHVGMLALQTQSPQLAEKLFDMAIHVHPNHYPARIGRAECHFKNGNLNGAIIDIDKAAEINGRYEYKALSAIMFYALGRNVEAKQIVDPSVEETKQFGGRPSMTSRAMLALHMAIEAGATIPPDEIKKLQDAGKFKLEEQDESNIVTLAHAFDKLKSLSAKWEREAVAIEDHASVFAKRTSGIAQQVAFLWNITHQDTIRLYREKNPQEKLPDLHRRRRQTRDHN